MSKKVLPFPPISRSLNGTSQSVSAAPAEEPFFRVNIVDDLYAHMGFSEGAVFIAESGKVVEGLMHYVELNGYGFLARLTDCTESTVRVYPFDRETLPGTYSRAEIQFIGFLFRHYPRGLNGSLWVLAPKEGLGLELPLFEAVAN
jgi:hypothetical protein